MGKKQIPFSPPDIGEDEINEVVDTLRSGWITTGPKTKKFEQEIAAYCGTEKAVCLSSATAGMELVLRLMGIGEGDEVITTPYTFAATANIILHCGAKPVFCDLKKDEFNIDPARIAEKITDKTKAVIAVDFGGFPCDYDEIKDVIKSKKELFNAAKGTKQECFQRIILIADAAHAFGAEYKGKKVGSVADFSVFSFHAVKNLTTAEGGAVTFDALPGIPADRMYKEFMLFSLHGQSKDALAKMKASNWHYTIDFPGYKYNMTDISASLGLVQLRRYEKEILAIRKKLYNTYCEQLQDTRSIILPPFAHGDKQNSFHLFPIRIAGFEEEQRNNVIELMAEEGVAVNVHFIPLVMQPAYESLGYSIKEYPNCYAMYKNVITLPLYSRLTEEDVVYICTLLKKYVPENQ